MLYRRTHRVIADSLRLDDEPSDAAFLTNFFFVAFDHAGLVTLPRYWYW